MGSSTVVTSSIIIAPFGYFTRCSMLTKGGRGGKSPGGIVCSSYLKGEVKER